MLVIFKINKMGDNQSGSPRINQFEVDVKDKIQSDRNSNQRNGRPKEYFQPGCIDFFCNSENHDCPNDQKR